MVFVDASQVVSDVSVTAGVVEPVPTQHSEKISSPEPTALSPLLVIRFLNSPRNRFVPSAFTASMRYLPFIRTVMPALMVSCFTLMYPS